jgi:N-carbamoylputrescine amidase
MGADLLFYPTGIGSDCHDHWQTAMQGHAASNITPLIASNRIGRETGEFGETTFWGRSFIAGPTGQIVAKAGSDREEVVTAEFDLEANREKRANWGIFRDRRPDLYWPLMTLDGKSLQSSTPPHGR